MRMKCPLCHKEMRLIGDTNIGWDCPTEDLIKEAIKDRYSNSWFDRHVPHYSIRGARADVSIFPFKIETWTLQENEGVSTVFHWLEDKHNFEKVFTAPAISPDESDKLLARLKLLMVFS